MSNQSITNPILLNFPEKIWTPRLLLRPVMPGDGAATSEAMKESAATAGPWLPWVRGADQSAEFYELRARQSYARWILREDLSFAILDRDSGKLLGGVGLHRPLWQIPRLELGYWIRTSEEGKGFALEASNVMTRLAFELFKCRRLEVKCNAENLRSRKIPEVLGFALEGIHFRDDNFAEKLGDVAFYARLNASGLPSLDVKW